MREFTKIKLADKGTKVHLEYKDLDTGNEYTATIAEQPHPDFMAALAAVRVWVPVMCEITQQNFVDAITVNGCSFSYGESNGVTITVLRALKNSDAPWVINTPHFKDESWPGGLFPLLDDLKLEANLLLDGKRAQGSLFESTVDTQIGEIRDIPVEISVNGGPKVKTSTKQISAVAKGLKNGTIKPRRNNRGASARA